MPDLDTRIRSLVASAVADAPPAPDLDALGARAPRRPNWFTRGALALSALLVGLGGVAALQSADDTDVDTRDTTTTTAAAPVPAEPIIVTAGPEGVVEIVSDRRRTVTSEPMAFALALDDGTFVAQRSGTDGGSTHPLFIGNDGAVTGEMFAGADLAGPVHLHDFSVVDGRRLLLYSIQITGDPETAREPLVALDLDSNETIELGNIGGWESGTGRLHLGANGLIAGTMFSEATHELIVLAIPGSPAAAKPLPTATDYGLEEFYNDCNCPDGFVLNASGENLYWLEPNPSGGVQVMISAVGLPAPLSVGYLPEVESVGGIDIDISQRGIVFSAGTKVGGSQPFLLKDAGTREPLPGTYATVGPNG